MKKLAVLVMSTVLFISCSKNDEMDNSEVINTMNPTTFVMGDFVSLAHPTSGKASVNSDKTVLTFTNFKTDNGPKLLVYLATDAKATDFVNLGDLKGISGNFTYTIPANTDLSKYKIVNIWCVDFSVSFGIADLK